MATVSLEGAVVVVRVAAVVIGVLGAGKVLLVLRKTHCIGNMLKVVVLLVLQNLQRDKEHLLSSLYIISKVVMPLTGNNSLLGYSRIHRQAILRQVKKTSIVLTA